MYSRNNRSCCDNGDSLLWVIAIAALVIAIVALILVLTLLTPPEIAGGIQAKLTGAEGGLLSESASFVNTSRSIAYDAGAGVFTISA